MSLEQPLNAAESELEELLRVEPSLHFAASVGQRVASEQMRGPWWMPRLAFAAAAGAIAVGVWGLSVERAPRPDATRVAPPPPAVVAIAKQDTPPPPVSPPAVRRVARARAALPPRPPATAPDVVVDARQAEAIARLLELARTQTVLSVPEAAAAKPLSVAPLSIAPILSDPAIPATGAERSSS
jgi:hypothetical protein